MYSIGTASRLSGVPVETIRIWECRDGVPMPRRTKGGHRKYSDQHVTLLQAMKALVDNGVRIGTLTDRPVDEILAAAERLTQDQAVMSAVREATDYEVDHTLVCGVREAGERAPHRLAPAARGGSRVTSRWP